MDAALCFSPPRCNELITQEGLPAQPTYLPTYLLTHVPTFYALLAKEVALASPWTQGNRAGRPLHYLQQDFQHPALPVDRLPAFVSLFEIPFLRLPRTSGLVGGLLRDIDEMSLSEV